MKSKVIFIRHGITEGNLKKWYYGSADLPLSDHGFDQVRELCEKNVYPEIPEHADCYTTGLTRTEQTFNLIYGDREHGHIDNLKEMNFGVYECKSFEELKDDPVFLKWGYDEEGDVVLPEGESRNMFFARIKKGLKELLAKHHLKEIELRHKDEDAVTVMVCHGGVITTIMNLLFPDERENPWSWMPDPGYGYIVEFTDGEATGYEKITEK